MADPFDKLGVRKRKCQSLTIVQLEVDILLPNQEEDAREALYRVEIGTLQMLMQDPLLGLTVIKTVSKLEHLSAY